MEAFEIKNKIIIIFLVQIYFLMKKNFFLILFSIFKLLLVEISVRLFYPQSLADYWKDNENEFGLLE